MPTFSKRSPSYRLHRPSGQAAVTLDGRDYYLGKYNTPSSRQRYDAVLAEWLAGGRRLEHVSQLTVAELVVRYWRFAERYYSRNGRPTVELEKLRASARPLVQVYGRMRAADFGPLALKTVRQKMIDDGCVRRGPDGKVKLRRSNTRLHINQSIGRIKRFFKWGVENELVPPSVYHGLQAVAGLKRGRCEARETEPVRPVPDEYVDAIKPHVSRQVWAMVELQRLTGMRPGEVVIMRGRDLDTAGKIWIYRPESHNTQHHGYDRIVDLGPRARKIVKPFLKPDVDAYLFSPVDAEAERRSAQHAKRTTPMKYGNRPGTNRKRKPKRTPRDRYYVSSYRRAIQRACDVADAKAKADSIEAGKEPTAERIVPRWHPHQLRHNFATRIRKQYGVEAARILLGHKSTAVTELYAEVDRGRVREIVAGVG